MMKTSNLVGFALLAITTGAFAHIEINQEVAVVKKQEVSPKLTADEMAFAGKLSDKHRVVFTQKFNVDQRKAAMKMSCEGPSNCGSARSADKKTLTPNEAVMKVMKDNHISMDEKSEAQHAH